MTRLFRKRHAFTLVELLIVITIIGILAAVAIPQFGDSSTDAKIAALDQNLSCIRSATELYHYQHNGTYPGTVQKHSKTDGGVTAAHANASEAFALQLTTYSNATGDTCDEKSSNYPYGPYLRQGMPQNPLPADGVSSAQADDVNVTTSTTPLSADGTPTTGWKASSATGEFIANNAAYASR